MTWTRPMRRGALTMVAATAAMIAVTLLYLVNRPEAEAVSRWDFLKLAIVIAMVWSAIGATMTFFIVMILKKNGGRP